MNVHYSTTNGLPTGRASHFYKDVNEAVKVAHGQNAKAETMGIKSRYETATCLESDLPQNEKAR